MLRSFRSQFLTLMDMVKGFFSFLFYKLLVLTLLVASLVFHSFKVISSIKTKEKLNQCTHSMTTSPLSMKMSFVLFFHFIMVGIVLRQLNILKRIGAVDVKEGPKFIVPIVCRNIV